MNRNGHKDTRFFLGTEVEHTPALGMKTLFVVGVQPVQDIESVLKDSFANIVEPVQHIYFGANQSFPNPDTNDFDTWRSWEFMVLYFLNRGYWCTLDIDIASTEGLAESGLCEHNTFIPMISAKLPYIKLLNYNATLKIDDVDFAATNPGVWCHPIHELQNRKVFTDWSKYKQDQTL